MNPANSTPGAIVLALSLFLAGDASAQAENSVGAIPDAVFDKIDWEAGQIHAELGDIAEIRVPEGYLYTDAADTRRVMTAMHRLPTQLELGFMAPRDIAWFVLFEFDPSGYVEDPGQDRFDPDALLAALRARQGQANEDLRSRGWPTATLEGWAEAPSYDIQTHRLEWALRVQDSDGRSNINLCERLLGRTGVLSVSAVLEPEVFPQVLPVFKTLLESLVFKAGKSHAEHTAGDPVAQDGPRALLTGGVAVVMSRPGRLDLLLQMIPRWLRHIRRGPIAVIFVFGVGLAKGYSAIARRIRRQLLRRRKVRAA